MRARLASTVFGLMNNAAATSRFVMPEAASSATLSSEESGNAETSEAAEPLTKTDFGDRIYAAFQEAGTLKFEIEQTGAASSVRAA